MTYSPTSWDAVPSALRDLTAEFGMGSGVFFALWPPDLRSGRSVPAARGMRLRAGRGVDAVGRPGRSAGPAGRARLRPPFRDLVCLSRVDAPTVLRFRGARPPGGAVHRGGRSPSSGSDQAARAISTGQLSALLHLHLRPIDVVVFHGSLGDLVSRGVSRLDAFSGYPVRTWLPCTAAGATTGPPVVRPSRSSRTRDSSSQVSDTHGR